MVLSYVLLLPMLFYASGGEFSFESKLGKTQSGAYQNGITAMQTSDASAERAVEVTIALSVVACSVAFSHRSVAKDLCALRPLWLMILWVGASTLWSSDPISSARNTVYLLLNTSFALYLSRRFPPEEMMSFISLVGTAFLAANYTVSMLFPRYGMAPSDSGMAWQGICVHKNICAYMTVFFMSAVLCQRATTIFAWLFRTIHVSASLLLIVLTQSRTGWILTGFVLLFIPISRLVKSMARRDAPIVGLICALPAAVTLCLTVTVLPTFFSLIGKDSSMNGRLPIWAAVATSILKHPILGYGYRAFWHNGVSGENATAVMSVGWNPRFAHNGLLEIGLELGGVGMILALWAIFNALRDAKRCFRSRESVAVEWYICVVFLTIIINIDESTLFECTHLGWTFFVLACAGLSASVCKSSTVSKSVAEVPRKAIEKYAA